MDKAETNRWRAHIEQFGANFDDEFVLTLLDHIDALEQKREGWKLVRIGKGAITNGMKAQCIAEFTFKISDSCHECMDIGADEECEVCHGEVAYKREVVVPWDTCKEIYRAMLAAAPEPQEVQE